jgi:hypothetical protein
MISPKEKSRPRYVAHYWGKEKKIKGKIITNEDLGMLPINGGNF